MGVCMRALELFAVAIPPGTRRQCAGPWEGCGTGCGYSLDDPHKCEPLHEGGDDWVGLGRSRYILRRLDYSLNGQ